MKRSEAEALVAAIVSMRDAATDAQASKAIQAYPTLKGNGKLVRAGTRINWNGQLKRAAVDLWDTSENNPESAPNLWEDVNYRDGYRIIPETITVVLMFALDEIGWWGDTLYKSKIANNVHTPEQNPYGWEEVVTDV